MPVLPVLNVKRGIYQTLRRWDLRTKYKNLQNFITNVEIDKSPLEIEGQKIAVISPHPDDESIACGGTLSLLAKKRNSIEVVYLTEGEYGVAPTTHWTPEVGAQLKITRRKEAARACEILGVKKYQFLGGNDTQLHLQGKLSEPLARIINESEFDIVFCPWPFDAHSDHAAAYHILRDALFHVRKNVSIWLYEVWNPLLANRIVNIDSAVDKKLEAIAAHNSQKAISDFSKKFVALAEYRSLSLNNCRYAEAYFVCDKVFVIKSLKFA
jgi:N-acetylglucosamine malate deacetylase 1